LRPFMHIHHTFPASSPPIGARHPRVDDVIALVEREYGVSKALILNASRCRVQAAKARQKAMYLSHVVLGQTLTAVGQAFGRDRTTVSYACGLVEDMRDDPRVDEELDRLEAALLSREAGRD
jgi:chromosomal replication initiation ATPase DnaA